MALLPTGKLLGEFERRVISANQIDIAVAWVGPSPALKLLRNVARKKKIRVRVAVGLSGNSTSPEALRSLQEFADVRIAHSDTGIFHPKFYLFHSGREAVCWVGSANFTLGGFAVNSELVNEFADDGTAHQWFEDFWDRLNPNSTDEINQYVAAWKRPPGGSPQENFSPVGARTIRLNFCWSHPNLGANTWSRFRLVMPTGIDDHLPKNGQKKFRC
jgi:HKD family nuclease